MYHFINQAKLLKEILGLNREPVGVQFLKSSDELGSLEGYDQTTKMRYCQALMLAGQGKKILLSKENLACAAAGSALGLRPLHPKLASGEAHFNTGVFGSRESAQKIMQEMPRLEQDVYKFIKLGPLGEIDWKPDLIVIEAHPEAVMWLSLATVYLQGERLQFSTSVVQGTCVDVTAVPLLTGKPNASFGCTGCREASDLTIYEALFGFPIKHLESITENLQLLNQKTIPGNRNKQFYKRFSGQ
ncbi:DUF169 domain-containing protein [Syntrophomonas erecta]